MRPETARASPMARAPRPPPHPGPDSDPAAGPAELPRPVAFPGAIPMTAAARRQPSPSSNQGDPLAAAMIRLPRSVATGYDRRTLTLVTDSPIGLAIPITVPTRAGGLWRSSQSPA